ncbi:MAG: hypothetical protein F6K00_12655 [Leptolyngbya sp. SIOISBB]|nr:hypothetical protein [Leptolyngbya sp. SIOISBB]
MAQQFPGVERLTPDQGKDWNERLVHLQGRDAKRQRRVDLGRLWRWYGAAHVLGRSEGYLSRITEVAREVVGGAALSAKAKVAMERDCNAAADLGKKATPKSSLDIKTERFSGLDMES